MCRVCLWKDSIKVVSFDCGGTIYYETEEDYVVFHRILIKLGHRFESSKVKEALEDARRWWRQERTRSKEVWNEKAWIKLLQKMVLDLAIPDKALAERLCDCYLSEAGFQAYGDAKSVLKKLKDVGFRLIAISNVSSSRNLATYLRKAGVLEYFEMLVASGDVGYEKPNPEIFNIASKLSETPVKNILHVGDKYEEDYLGACAAGMNAILIDREGVHVNKRCPRMSSLTELFGLLDHSL